MKNQYKNLLAALLIAILLAVVGFYIYKDLNKTDDIGAKPSVEKQDVVPVIIDPSKSGAGYTVKVIDTPPSPKTVPATQMPDLGLPVVNLSRLDDSVFKIMVSNMSILAARIKKDPANEALWLNFGIYRKDVGDYNGVVDILNYVSAVWSNDYVPYNNLADLYQFYIKNYPLAEKNWLKVINLKMDYIQAYQNLSDLYGAQYTEKKDQSMPILLTGLNNNPHSIDLMISIARWYKAAGNKDKAAEYYSKAIMEAKDQNYQDAVSSLRSEAGL